jgi:elongation factor P hydroxylase
VALASIEEIDSVYWFDDQFQRATVRRVVDHVRLIEEVELSHPIILGSDGRVMDGMHRIAKALLEGRTTISAVQFEYEIEPDYRNCRPEDLPY